MDWGVRYQEGLAQGNRLQMSPPVALGMWRFDLLPGQATHAVSSPHLVLPDFGQGYDILIRIGEPGDFVPSGMVQIPCSS
jgi:hypothetical protein